MQTLKDSVKIFLKIKPPTEPSTFSQLSPIQQLDPTLVSLDNKLYKFDHISPVSSPLEDFFSHTMPQILEDFSSGCSVLIFTYGQSDSGKTFTLYGSPKEKGFIQLSCELLLQSPSIRSLTCSFAEIFQENVFDLLLANKGEELKGKVGIEGLFEESLTVDMEVENLLRRVMRKVGKGHSVFVVGIRDKPQKIMFVDLAGVERSKSTFASQEKAKENSLANKSISALRSVFKGMARGNGFINYRDSKLTFLLKDWLQSSKIVLVSTVIPTKKSFLDTINTIKFAQTVRKMKKSEPDFKEIETILYLQQKIEELQQSLVFHLKNSEILQKLEEEHKNCEKKEANYLEKIMYLEQEVKVLRKEVLEINKVDSGDWLLSSDSEDHESYQQLNKEKSGLEVSLAVLQEKIDEKNKDLSRIGEVLAKTEKEKEFQVNLVSQLGAQVEDLKTKVEKYQELCVLLGRLNSNLVSEMNVNGESGSDSVPDHSYMSSTDASKLEIYKIIEGKDAKVNSLIENYKVTEENLHKLREKYFFDTNSYKKQVAKLKRELENTKAENIKDNEYAMQVLDELKTEKNKLLAIIENLGDGTEKKKIAELKEMNGILLENLRMKGQQVSELQKKFQEFLKQKENCEEIQEKLSKKSEKNQILKKDFYKIHAQLTKIPQLRKKLESIGTVDCVLELISLLYSRRVKSGSFTEFEKQGLYQ